VSAGFTTAFTSPKTCGYDPDIYAINNCAMRNSGGADTASLRPGPEQDTRRPTLDNTSPAWRRAWHAVALSSEVGAEPVAVTLLGEQWVLARIGDAGEVSAFIDVCPHRLAPLSAGRVEGTQLRCGYHGWVFDKSGACKEIPALGPTANIPPRARLVAAAGVQERYGLIWIAPEEPVCDIHEFPEWDAGEAEGFDRIWSTILRTPVSAAQLVDNFLDASHFPFVHPSTFGTDEAAVVADRGIERDGWVVRTTFDSWYRNFDDPLVATGEHEAVQPQELLKQGDAGLTVYLRLYFPVTDSTLAILFCCLPESATSTRIFKLIARDDYAGDTGRIAQCIADEDQILAEDLAILERYQRFEIHLDNRRELHTKADRLSVAWRRVLGDLVSFDQQPASETLTLTEGSPNARIA
jgi:phenylpropionate dioxygenase-like ring-hydroxylating dioxygenase large terminal subunit